MFPSNIYRITTGKRFWLTGEFYQIFKELIPILLKLKKNFEKEETLLNVFSEASITLKSKPDTDTATKENYRPISIMNINKNFSTK